MRGDSWHKLKEWDAVECSQKVDTGKRNTLSFHWKARTGGSSLYYFS